MSSSNVYSLIKFIQQSIPHKVTLGGIQLHTNGAQLLQYGTSWTVHNMGPSVAICYTFT